MLRFLKRRLTRPNTVFPLSMLAAALTILFVMGGVLHPAPATAVPVLQVTGGILNGATGVEVGGTLYDVSFIDDSNIFLFGGDCNRYCEFTSPSTALAAAQALYDMFHLPGNELYNNNPELTNGCFVDPICGIITPYLQVFQIIDPKLFVAIYENRDPYFGSINDAVYIVSLQGAYDSRVFPDSTFAVWRRHHHAVPEPSALILLALGLLGLAGYQWRQQRQKRLQVG